MAIIEIGSEKEKQLLKLDELTKEIRGSFLSQAIAIENFVGDVITFHFCLEENRQNLFFSLVTGEISFSRKIKILKKILEIEYPELLKENTELINNLDKIKRFRNTLVHSMLDNSDDFLEKKHQDRIRVVYYKDGEKKTRTITRKENIERLKECTKTIIALVNIRKQIVEMSPKNFKNKED